MTDTYIIRGGLPGRERLQVLARVTWPATEALLLRAGVGPGLRCLDLGCGSGEVTRELGRMVGPTGSALGLDFDRIKLKAAQADARAAGLRQVTFEAVDIVHGLPELPPLDLGYARFLLTHLVDPLAALRHLVAAVRPGGVVVLEDIDISGQVCSPPSAAFAAFTDIYRRTGRARGADPDIGPRLPLLLREAGVAPVEARIVQPAGLDGDVKQIATLTMEAIAPAAVAAGTADAATVEGILAELRRLGADGSTLMSMARVTQVWGRKPG